MNGSLARLATQAIFLAAAAGESQKLTLALLKIKSSLGVVFGGCELMNK